MALSWAGFIALWMLSYLLINTTFGLAYWASPGCVRGATSYLDHFFFSVQTLATIGYGDMTPSTLYAHCLATLEAWLGTIGLGLLAGLTFAKFSIPSARIQFSRWVCIYRRAGQAVLEVRLVNQRVNQLLQFQVELTLARNIVNERGEVERRLFPLELQTDQTPVFALSFVVTHPLSDSSPLKEMTPASAEACSCELILLARGVDDALAQMVYACHVYTYKDVRWNEQFASTLTVSAEGSLELDLSRFDRTEAVEQAWP